ncbi:MAG: hypothetical protein DRJ18_02240 [Candidatus Methanomethylicota archaeon]|nr:MAG: hypothetical protein DRJ18_02240 [Candidatus Verstraetearchaeota archaeon]
MNAEFHMVYYFHMRRSTFPQKRKELDYAVGVTCQIDRKHYFLCADIDNPKHVKHILNNLPSWVVNKMCGLIVTETRKGNHVIILGRFKWRECNRFWTMFKNVIDRGWIQLQRLRHNHMNRIGAVLRVCGKYRVPDVRVLVAIYDRCDDGIKWWVERYLAAVKICRRRGASRARDKGIYRQGIA